MAYLFRGTLPMARHLCKITGGASITQVEPLVTSAFAFWQKQKPVHAAGGAGEAGTNAQKKTKEFSLKITLIHNENVSVTGLEEARNLAKRRSMHLVQVQKMDTKTQRPVYKLLTSAERLQEELSDLTPQEKSHEKANQKKSEKTLTIGCRISDNDLASRLKNISKWLEKRHEVRILIQGSEKDMTSCEKVFKTIEESVRSPNVIGKIVQKRTKGSIIKFNIVPIAPSSAEGVSAPTIQ